MEGPDIAGLADLQRRMASLPGGVARTVALVEGPSDRVAVEAAARLSAVRLEERGALVASMAGITNIGHFLDLVARIAPSASVVCLCDASEERLVVRASRARGVTIPVEVCVADLEEELIRALGPAEAAEVISAAGDGASLESMQGQPAWRGADPGRQIRRFLGAGSGRKVRYAEVFVDALGPTRLPAPLTRLLARL